MVNIHRSSKVVGIEWNVPAVPENIQVAVRNNYTTSLNIVSNWERTFLCRVSTSDQCILITGVLSEHRINQAAYILSDASSLPDASCIVERNTHERVLSGYGGREVLIVILGPYPMAINHVDQIDWYLSSYLTP